MKSLNKERISIQKELYVVAKNQHTDIQLNVVDNAQQKANLSIKVNESSKMATPLLVTGFDRKSLTPSQSTKEKDLYSAAQLIIENHKNGKNENSTLKEKLTNIVNNTPPTQAMKYTPELKAYYKELPKLNQVAEKITGKNNQELFVSRSKEKLIEQVVKQIVKPTVNHDKKDQTNER